MKAQFSKFGPKQDYRGAHAVMDYAGRNLLGTIKDVYRDDITGAARCKVSHFNGESWPIEPRLSALEILERDKATMDIDTYLARAIPRLAEIDRLDAMCEWTKHNFECTPEVQALRKQRQALMDEQSLDELAAGF